MGNGESVQEETVLQEQDSEHVWQLVRRDQDVDKGEDGCCLFITYPGKGTQAERCKNALQHLRLLRHPNIVKFLDSEVTPEFISMKTEVVVPLISTLVGQQWEGLVRGWRDVAHGLEFLHYKAGVSHNNVHVGGVFVGGTTTQWKLGGFEAAHKHKAITPSFINSVSSVRNLAAIPPEDKGSIDPSQPIHCRDVWALGQLMVQTIEDSEQQSHVPEEVLVYISEEMQITPAVNRSAVSDFLQQPWMSNNMTAIVDFLTKITLHSQEAKDSFFSSLPIQLHSLSPTLLAEHVVPLLCTALVMAEPKSSLIWPHLLCPTSKTNPRQKVFDESKICPLLSEELFSAHILPLLLDLLETRDSHVRLVLLEHLESFAYLCSSEDIKEFLLPEVLVGLKATQDDIVAATLQALSILVPLVGSATVMGTSKSKKTIFTDARPKMSRSTTPVSRSPSLSCSSEHSSVDKERPTCRRTEDRLERMRKKREEQRKKREEQIKKREKTATKSLGITATTTTSEFLACSAEEDEEEEEVVVGEKLRKKSASQYSPSVSHDEEEQEIEVEEEDAWEAFETIKSTPNWRDETEGSNHRETKQSVTSTKPAPFKISSPSSSSKSIKLLKPESDIIQKPQIESTTIVSPSSEKTALSKIRDNLKGRMCEEDIVRLETQLLWTQQEKDIFADIEPEIPSTSHLSPPLVQNKSTVVSQEPNLSLQPQHEVEVGGEWGDDGWDDF